MDWRGFELHPETPPGGMDLTEMFGPRAVQMVEQVKGFATQFGVEGLSPPMHSPNTRGVLAIAEYARDLGRLVPFRDAAMAAHWQKGLDLENPEHLRQVALEAGLDVEAALSARTDERYLSRVEAVRLESHRAGVTGIPTFFFGTLKVVGCQPYEVIRQAAQMAGARARPP